MHPMDDDAGPWCVPARTSAQWVERMSAAILTHFHAAHAGVPAYRQFLASKGVDPASIRAASDIPRIPPITRDNYLRAYPWAALCVDGALANEALVLTSTSGSTGQPLHVLRSEEADQTHARFVWRFIEQSGLDRSKPTLAIVCFGMGIWIGGLLTYEGFRRIAADRWPLSIVTPGVNKPEIFKTLTQVAPAYAQLVLCGYPPFVKDLIDEAPAHGVDWQHWDLRILGAAEAFSERFRDYLCAKTGMRDPLRSVMSIYGTAELGTMATETPLAILLRRLAIAHQPLYASLFHDARRLPTLAQFVPDRVCFEATPQGALFVTGGHPMPMIRYDIGDQGGVFTYADALRLCHEAGVDLAAEVQRLGIADSASELPFVYVYERADLSTKLYGAIIYPEHVKHGLLQPEFEALITGHFSMTTEHDQDHNEYLEIHVELRPGVECTDMIGSRLSTAIAAGLRAHSSEYRYTADAMPERSMPRIVCWPHEHPTYFPPGIKQQWVLRARG